MEPGSPSPPSRALIAGLLALIGIGFISHSLVYRFTQDDAYIFFRYAEHWIQGHGPVWNVGERVEGYSSPLWLAVVTVAGRCFGTFEPAVHVISIAFGVAALGALFLLTASMTRSAWAGLAAALLLASDRTYALWSTSGMETRLFSLLLVVSALLVRRGSSGRLSSIERWLPGPVLALLCLARPEGALFAGFFVLFLILRRRSVPFDRRIWISLGTGGAALAAHLFFRRLYYGDFLPNTFYAKVPGLDPSSGTAYLTDFARSFPLISLAAALGLLAHLGLAVVRRRWTFGSLLAVTTVAYLAYVVAIGGGFMEFRFLDPVITLTVVLFVTALWTVHRTSRHRLAPILTATVVILLATVGLNHGMQFEDRDHMVMNRSEMWHESTRVWSMIGRSFGRFARPEESLATTAAGAIPYFSKLRALDQFGLNDAVIAHAPPFEDNAVGHRKRATEAYIREKGITFVIGHPRVYGRPDAGALRPGEFFIRIDDPSGVSFFLAVRTTQDRRALIESLRKRGVTVVEFDDP